MHGCNLHHNSRFDDVGSLIMNWHGKKLHLKLTIVKIIRPGNLFKIGRIVSVQLLKNISELFYHLLLVFQYPRSMRHGLNPPAKSQFQVQARYIISVLFFFFHSLLLVIPILAIMFRIMTMNLMMLMIIKVTHQQNECREKRSIKSSISFVSFTPTSQLVINCASPSSVAIHNSTFDITFEQLLPSRYETYDVYQKYK